MQNSFSISGAATIPIIWNDDYRYSFNGMEKDNEITGSKSHLNFGARIYDSRVGRWLSGDSFERGYPQTSTYSFAGNSPILLIDVEGNYKVPANVRQEYPIFSALVDNIYNVPANNQTIQKNLEFYGGYHGLNDTQSVLGPGSGPEIRVTNFQGDGETGFVAGNGTYDATNPDKTPSTAEVYVAINVRIVKRYEKLGTKLQDESLTGKKRERVERRFFEYTVAITATLLHESVHVGDYMKNGYFSNKDIEGKEYTGYASNDPARAEIGSAFERESGLVDTYGYSIESGELFNEIIDLVKAREIVKKTTPTNTEEQE